MGKPSETAVKFLFAHSRNLCFFNTPGMPACEVQLTERDCSKVLGQIAHICSEKRDGPRHDPALSARAVQEEPNLLLLCPNHHVRIDQMEPERFDPRSLQEMKERHIARSSDRPWTQDQEAIERVARTMIASYLASASSDDDAPLRDYLVGSSVTRGDDGLPQVTDNTIFMRRPFASVDEEAVAMANYDALRASGVSREKAYRLALSTDPDAPEMLANWLDEMRSPDDVN